MKEFWNFIQMVFMAVGGWLGWFMGGCDGLLYALIAFVVIDYLTGVMCAFVDHTLSLQKRSARLPSEKRRRGALLQFYSFAMAASIMACASATMASSSGIRPGIGSRTPPSSRPYIRRRISFCTAYRLPWASHIL
mgnify:CR=1 FL=1